MKLKLPTVVLAMLKKRGSVVDTKLRTTRTQLLKTCEEHRYTCHPSVIAFEAAFGGLLIPDGPKMKKDEPCWLFGTHACMTTGGHTNPRGGSKARKLVPVVYSPNDIIYYLDDQGRGYAEDTIEDPSATRYADDGTSLVCRIVFDDALFDRKETSIELKGLQGDVLSKQLSLKLVNKASGQDRRFFSNATGDILVVEEVKSKRTIFAGSTTKHLKLVAKPVVRGAASASPELVPFLGKESIWMVGEQRTSIPEFFEHLPDLRDLDVSINKLQSLPESLWRATQLKALDLGFNPLKELPDGIGNMTALKSLSLRGCPLKVLPEALAGAKNITKLIITECMELDVNAALAVIAKLPKLTDLSLPLAASLTSLSAITHLPLKSLYLNGIYVKHPTQLPSGLGQLKKLTNLRIEYADDVAHLPDAPEDVKALRLIFSKRFTDDDIRKSASKQPSNLYLRAFADTLK